MRIFAPGLIRRELGRNLIGVCELALRFMTEVRIHWRFPWQTVTGIRPQLGRVPVVLVGGCAVGLRVGSLLVITVKPRYSKTSL